MTLMREQQKQLLESMIVTARLETVPGVVIKSESSDICTKNMVKVQDVVFVLESKDGEKIAFVTEAYEVYLGYVIQDDCVVCVSERPSFATVAKTVVAEIASMILTKELDLDIKAWMQDLEKCDEYAMLQDFDVDSYWYGVI